MVVIPYISREILPFLDISFMSENITPEELENIVALGEEEND